MKLQKPATILYIEDNPENIEVVEKFLKKWPETNLSCALKPQAGIDLARKLNPDLILIDIQLPEMDGFAVFNKLRSFEETARIPVIALSANAMPQNIEKAYSIGFQGYLTKPLDIAEFSSALKKILE